MIKIREEQAGDSDAIYKVNAAAFARPAEAALVDTLRDEGAVTLSLVAVVDKQIVGHILFSPVLVAGEGEGWSAVALGPMAVLPAHQGHGVGAALVRAGLAQLWRAGHEVVFVLGHSGFYPRFGFTVATAHGLRCQWDVPDDVFMVVASQPDVLGKRRGTVYYHAAFAGV
jgi:putative acetyltransferase